MVNPSKIISSSQWIKKNMMGVYSEELGRPWTEAELRVQRCLEQLQIPDWYIKYSRPANILKSDVTIDRRPSTWKVSPKKKRSPRTTPKKNKQAEEKPCIKESPLNSTYRITRKVNSSMKNKPEISITSSSSEDDEESKESNNMTNQLEKSTDLPSFRSPKLNTSHTFPRIAPSRKIENINIIFPKDFTPKPPRTSYSSSNSSVKSTSTPKTVYTLTKNFQVQPQQQDPNNTYTCEDSMEVNNSHTSFLFAEIEPTGITNTVHVFAGIDSDPEENNLRIETPNTRFFRSQKKSSELEKIVQSRRVNKKQRVQEIIEELDRSIAENKSICNTSTTDSAFTGSFVRSMVRALEQSDSEDSDLAKSTTISFFEEEETEDDERPTTPLSRLQETEDEDDDDDEEEEEEDVYWIPSKISELPRTSSRLSMLSRGSSMNGFQCTSGRCSPGLSPIKTGQYDNNNRTGWGLTYSSRGSRISRQLFRIDETGVADSGYERSNTAYSGTTGTICSSSSSDGDRSTPSPMSSVSSSPTLTEFPELGITNEMLYNRSGPFVMKSVVV